MCKKIFNIIFRVLSAFLYLMSENGIVFVLYFYLERKYCTSLCGKTSYLLGFKEILQVLSLGQLTANENVIHMKFVFGITGRALEQHIF